MSTRNTLECASESGFRTSSKRSVLMRIDALWCVYTIQFAHNVAAVHDEQHSVIVLYREGKVQSCKGFAKEWFDRQHTNMSSLYREGFGEGQKRHTVSNCSGYLRKFLQSIPLWTFVSFAACQWRRGQFRLYPGGSGVRQLEAITESPQQYGCSQDLLGVVPASTNDALSTARLALHEGRRGELWEGGPCQGPYVSLSYSWRLTR